MSDNPEIGQVDLKELSPLGLARVVHHLRHALALMEEAQQSMTVALDYFEAEATTLVTHVEAALAGQLALTELTAEERVRFNKRVDETVGVRLDDSDYVGDLLAEGVTKVVLDGDDMVELQPDFKRRRL